jgi:hypothetical protein
LQSRPDPPVAESTVLPVDSRRATLLKPERDRVIVLEIEEMDGSDERGVHVARVTERNRIL